jgi:hypothetical protein
LLALLNIGIIYVEVIKMDIQISKDILKETIKCKKTFSCLSDQNDICEMKSGNPQEVFFIKYPKDKGCGYEYSYGYSDHICTCPTRQEIFRRYGI